MGEVERHHIKSLDYYSSIGVSLQRMVKRMINVPADGMGICRRVQDSGLEGNHLPLFFLRVKRAIVVVVVVVFTLKTVLTSIQYYPSLSYLSRQRNYA